MGESTVVAIDTRADTPVWLGVAKDVAHLPSFYLTQLLEVTTKNKEITIRFSSEDNINDILKTVRANEVWGKAVDFFLFTVGPKLFLPWKTTRLCTCAITNVSRNGTTHTWVINFSHVETICR